jgi:fucose permease
LVNREIFICFLSAVGVGTALLNLTPVLPLLRMHYAASHAEMGILVSSLILSHSFIQLPAGFIVDKIGVQRALSLALTLAFMGNALCVWTQDYGFVLAMRILAGLGTGLIFVAGIKYAAVSTPVSSRALVQSIFGSLINAGSVLPFFVSPLLIDYGSGLIFLFTSLLFLVPLGFALSWNLKEGKEQDTAVRGKGALFGSPHLWSLGISHAVFFGGMMAVGTWISSFLVSMRAGDLRLVKAGLWGASVMGMSAIGRFMGGLAVRWVPPQSLISYALLLLIPSYILIGMVQKIHVTVALLFVVSFLNSITFGSIFFLSFKMIPSSSAGAAMGLVNFIASMGALWFPAIFGYLLDLTHGFVYPFIFVAAMAFLAFMCLLASRSIFENHL